LESELPTSTVPTLVVEWVAVTDGLNLNSIIIYNRCIDTKPIVSKNKRQYINIILVNIFYDIIMIEVIYFR